MGAWAVVCLLLAAPTAWGQSPGVAALPAAVRQFGATRPEQRAQLQRDLESHARILEAQSATLRIVAKLVGPTVVYVEADIAGDPRDALGRLPSEEVGSGVIVEIGDRFYVLTSRHVVRDAPPAAVHLSLADGRRLQPTRVLDDAETDVAVLPVEAPDLVASPIGDSDRMEIGDFVLAVGSPFGLRQTVTFGIISAKGRRDLQLDGAAEVRFQDFLQTDAQINAGNSGGPLVNLRGEVIGINNSIATKTGRNEGIGFAVPINMFMHVARQLIATGKVVRAFLGVNLNPRFGPAADAGLPRPVGAQVTGITPHSPAEAAGLLPGDVILEFNHAPIEDDGNLVNLVSMTDIGKRVPLLVFRDRRPVTLDVELGDRSKFEAKP